MSLTCSTLSLLSLATTRLYFDSSDNFWLATTASYWANQKRGDSRQKLAIFDETVIWANAVSPISTFTDGG